MESFDCEALATGFPAQPINTGSSLLFVLGAVVLWRRGRPAAASALALAGLGSVAFHGAPSVASAWLHDLGLAAAVAVAAVEVWRRIREHSVPVTAGATLLLGLGVWLLSRSGGPLCVPGSLLQGHAVWHALATAAMLSLFLASRPALHAAQPG